MSAIADALARADRAATAYNTCGLVEEPAQSDVDAACAEHSAAFGALAQADADSIEDLAEKVRLAAGFCREFVLQFGPEDDDSDHGIGWRLLAGIVRDAQRLARLEARP